MKITDSNLGQLISGLIYPASLGASIVYFFQKIVVQVTSSTVSSVLLDVKNWFALWLLFYFCLVYLSMTKYKLKKAYDWIHFILDFIEALLIFWGLFVLGFVVTDYVNMQYFYVVSLLIPILGWVTNCYTKGTIHWLQIVSIAILSIAMIGANFPKEENVHWVILFLFYILLGWYTCQFTKHREKID